MNTRLPAALSLAVGLSLLSPAHAADQTPAPAKAVVQISVTDVDTTDGKPLPSFAGVRGQRGLHDDLSTLKSFALTEGLTVTITPRFTITTFHGAAGSVNEQTKIPYMTLEDAPGVPSDTVQYAIIKSSLSAIPHFNFDGTITVDFTLIEREESNSAWRELGAPAIITSSTTNKLTFHDGDTLGLNYPIAEGFGQPTTPTEGHRAFLTVKLVPAKKD